MSARMVLNLTHALLLEGMGEEDRADLQAQLADPDGWQVEQDKKVRADLVAAGGEVA